MIGCTVLDYTRSDEGGEEAGRKGGREEGCVVLRRRFERISYVFSK